MRHVQSTINHIIQIVYSNSKNHKGIATPYFIYYYIIFLNTHTYSLFIMYIYIYDKKLIKCTKIYRNIKISEKLPNVSLFLYNFMTLRGTPFSCRVGPCSGRVGLCGSRVGLCSGRAGRCSCRVDSCLSGTLPCGCGAVLGHPCGCRVDSVSLPCSSAKLPCSSVSIPC